MTTGSCPGEIRPAENCTLSGLIGKAGEALVAAELPRRKINVAYPAYDGGVDLVAYREPDFNRVVPIQVKARSKTFYSFEKTWFRIERIVLVQVWNVASLPQFYIFKNLGQVEEALGPVHAISRSWTDHDKYNVTHPGPDALERMKPHQDRWERITEAV